MRIAVTGGYGFVGKQLVERLLARGDKVRVLTRRTAVEPLHRFLEVVSGDLTTASAGELIRFADGVDILYHCAGEIRDESRMEAVHVMGTQRLIDAARGRIGKWIQLSSVGAYGDVREGTVTEEWSDSPVGMYENTKTRSDNLVRIASLQGAFGLAVLRPSIIYGPTMRNQSLFRMIETINRGLFFFIGPTGATANYIHVENVVESLLLCGESRAKNGATYIVSDGCSLEDFVEIICKYLGRSAPKIRIPSGLARLIALGGRLRRGFPLTESRIDALTTRAIYSSNRIMSELGYAHSITLERGLEQIVDVVNRTAQ